MLISLLNLLKKKLRKSNKCKFINCCPYHNSKCRGDVFCKYREYNEYISKD